MTDRRQMVIYPAISGPHSRLICSGGVIVPDIDTTPTKVTLPTNPTEVPLRVVFDALQEVT